MDTCSWCGRRYRKGFTDSLCSEKCYRAKNLENFGKECSWCKKKFTGCGYGLWSDYCSKRCLNDATNPPRSGRGNTCFEKIKNFFMLVLIVILIIIFILLIFS